jgi:alanyl-tRNA synthetase
MDTEQTITTFIEFFRERSHKRITGTSLLPSPGDPVLFTTAGMHPLIPYLEGRTHPLGRRLVNVQRCLRTTDLDEVGDATHLTVFEMLGSWSLGDYDGPQSLRWGYELLHDGFRLDRLHVTVFGGNDEVEPDTLSMETWSDLGVPFEITTHENWWDNGPTGPCGPDSEIFVWTGEGSPQKTPTTDDRWVEVWNHVMIRYQRRSDGSLVPLAQRNVDTGMGLERLVTVLQRKQDVYATDIFRPWTRTVGGLWTLDNERLRLVSDHLRSAVVMIGDGVRPSNTKQGYVLRRLIRRLLTTLWSDDPARTLSDLPSEPIESTLRHFGQSGEPLAALRDEERRFRAVIDRGRPIVRKEALRRGGSFTDEDYFYLHDTHGLPRDVVDYLVSGTVTQT